MAGAHQIRAQVLAAADQVTQLLLLFGGHPHQPQFAGGEQPRQADRVALVGLDPIPRPALDVARRADRHLDPLRPRPADQPVAGRPRLIDRAQRPRQLAQHVEHLQRPADHPARDHLPGHIVKDRHGARVRVNVQPDPTHTVRHGRRPPYVWSRPRAQSSTCRTPRNARGVDHQPLAAPGRHPIGSEASGASDPLAREAADRGTAPYGLDAIAARLPCRRPFIRIGAVPPVRGKSREVRHRSVE